MLLNNMYDYYRMILKLNLTIVRKFKKSVHQRTKDIDNSNFTVMNPSVSFSPSTFVYIFTGLSLHGLIYLRCLFLS